MNATRDPERILSAWLDEGPTDLPDATRRAILISLPTTPQARRGLLAPGWLLPRRAGLQLAIGALVAVIIAGGLLYALGRDPDFGTPSPSPVPTLGPSATPGPSPRIAGATVAFPGGALAAGIQYVLPTFEPVFTFEGSADLWLGATGARYAWIDWVGSGSTTLGVVRAARVFDETGTSGAMPADIVGWLGDRSDLTILATTPVTLGATEGTLIEATVDPGAFANQGRAINVFCTGEPCRFEDGGSLGYAPGDHVLILVAIVGGTPVAAITATPAADWAARAPTLEAFLRSFNFPG